MANVLPISLEILACFILSTALLHRYSDMVNSNIITIVGVFISWFFSFMVIFMLPADLTSTAYRQCLFDYETSTNNSSNTTNIPIRGFQTTSLPITVTQPSLSIIPQHLAYSNQSLGSMSLVTSNLIPNSTINPCVIPWNYVSDSTLTKLWRFIYWTSQLLTWLILPIMQSYSMAGDFTTIDKLRSAVRANLIYYSSFGAIFMILLIYVIFRDGLDFANLKVIAISSSNTWGLFLLVVLLGYGLVELPRFLINRSRYSHSLTRLYFKVAKVNAEKCEAEEKLDDVLEEIHLAFAALGTAEHNPLKQYLNQIVEKCPPDWRKRSNAFRRQAAASNSAYDSGRSKTQVHDLRSMIRLHKKVIKAVHFHRQIICKWNHLIKEVIEWEDVARNQSENQIPLSNRKFKSTLPRERSTIDHVYTKRIEWFWKCLIRVWLLRVTGYLMAALSLAVVWSEIAFPISFFSSRLSIFALFVDIFQEAQQYFYLELFSTVSLGYLAICAFYTVFHMKIYNIYYLASNSRTDEYSLLFSGMLVCRLTAPLCLNYLCLVHRDSHIVKMKGSLETSFTTIMGHLDLIPIVNNGLNVFLPFCISAICLAIYCDFGTHLLHKLGFDQFIESDEMTIDWVQTGRELVGRETSKLLRNYESSSTTYHEMITPPKDQHVPVRNLPISGVSHQDEVLDPNNKSPTSSSSGFSQSELLPRAERQGSQDALSKPPSVMYSSHHEGHSSNRISDNIIEFGSTSNQQQEINAPKPSGFFDDV